VEIETIAEHACHGGVQGFYRAASPACGGPMRFALFQPPQARTQRVPVLYFLAGLTCSEETATIKAGAQRLAAELGLMLAPTPRVAASAAIRWAATVP
jgi:S-formylglutathione hydrolase